MVLDSLLGAIKDATSIAPQAFQTDSVGKPAITYSFYRATDNGAVAQWRLQVRVFGRNMREAVEIEEKLSDALVTLGDETRFGCSIESNGGGSMIDSDTNTAQMLTYFDITCKH
ncbi:hypothetical protein H7U34_01840 [Collinsella tanakaei]|nr:hypothetical protein [Collinsella tanakaei]